MLIHSLFAPTSTSDSSGIVCSTSVDGCESSRAVPFHNIGGATAGGTWSRRGWRAFMHLRSSARRREIVECPNMGGQRSAPARRFLEAKRFGFVPRACALSVSFNRASANLSGRVFRPQLGHAEAVFGRGGASSRRHFRKLPEEGKLMRDFHTIDDELHGVWR